MILTAWLGYVAVKVGRQVIAFRRIALTACSDSHTQTEPFSEKSVGTYQTTRRHNLQDPWNFKSQCTSHLRMNLILVKSTALGFCMYGNESSISVTGKEFLGCFSDNEANNSASGVYWKWRTKPMKCFVGKNVAKWIEELGGNKLKLRN
jgi:hypothetical protein